MDEKAGAFMLIGIYECVKLGVDLKILHQIVYTVSAL